MPRCPTCERDVEPAPFCPHDGTPLSHLGRVPVLPQAGDAIEGRYELIEELGKGGMAFVYRARSLALGHDVALKVLRPSWAEEKRTVARFAREARAASQIDHENVVKVYDFGWAEEGFYFLAMELLAGRPLHDVAYDGPRMRSGRALDLLVQVASGVARAHELGVIHRDLKPENVMVLRKHGRDSVTIVDFGLSKVVDGQGGVTREGDVIGTPDYMAPEQWRGASVDARADVYSFGVMAYELFAGAMPFGGDTILAKLHQHLHVEPTPLDRHEGARDLPEGISALVSRCMAKDRLDRPAHMGIVSRELARIDEAYRDAHRSGTVVGVAAVPMATVFAPVEDAGLDRAGLQGEIARLRRVRQHRLAALTAESFGGTLPEAIHALIAAIERSEAEVEQAGADVAIAEASLSEAERARRAKEAELRAALIDANLELAVLRSALPLSVTSPGRREAATIDLASTSVDDGVDLDDVAKARAALAKAERRLAQLVSAPDEAIADAERRLDEALAQMRELDDALAVHYEALEARVREIDARFVSSLAEIDAAIATYRERLHRLAP